MAISITKQQDKTYAYVTEYVADTVADVDTLPTTAAPGSICIVIEDSSVYMLNTNREWKKLG